MAPSARKLIYGKAATIELKVEIWKDLSSNSYPACFEIRHYKKKRKHFPQTTVVSLKALKKLYEMHNNSCTLPTFWDIS